MKRLCAECGKIVVNGMTNQDGDFYVHEGKCFVNYMNRIYGKHKWMELGNEAQDEFGGYYLGASENNEGFEGTGIYYTEWGD